MYIIRNISKLSEEDTFEQGCIGGASLLDTGVTLTGKTTEEVIKKFANFLGQDTKDAELNACDEDGRVEFGILENENGEQLDRIDVLRWKTGQIKAWYCVYTGYVEELKAVNLCTS